MLRSAKQLQDERRAFDRCPVDTATIRRLLEAAERKKRDAGRPANSCDTRVEAYYDACFNIALATLNASRWRARSGEGHHAYTLEAACRILGATESVFDRIDAIRELRNQKYSGIERTTRDVDAAERALTEFEALATAWFGSNRFDQAGSQSRSGKLSPTVQTSGTKTAS